MQHVRADFGPCWNSWNGWNVFCVPEKIFMKKLVNSLSGGRSSCYMAIHYPADINIFACVCIDYPKAAPKDPAILMYCLEKLNGNFIASAESEMTLRIMMQMEQRLGKKIVWVRGDSFDEVIDNAGCHPTWKRRFCTTELKIKPIFEYIYFRYGVVREQIGFRLDEAHRAYKTENEVNLFELINLFGDVQEAKAFVKKTYRKVESIMADYPISQNVFGERRNNLSEIMWAQKEYPMIDDKVDQSDVIRYWKGFPEFDFPPESNCAGCHHKKPVIIRNQAIQEPAILEWFSLQEQKKKKKNLGNKVNTWHDDMIPYEEKFKMNFTELMELSYGSCDSGYCHD